MRKLSFPLAGLVLSFAAHFSAHAQSGIAYGALISTPPGALPPVLSAPMLGETLPRPDLSLRYGHIGFRGYSTNAFAGTLDFPAGTRAVIGLTAGYQGYTCNQCDGHFIAGAVAEGRLTTTTLGSAADAPLLAIGANGEVGFGKPSGGTLLSFTAGLPVALLTGTPTLRIAPFLTPAFGWGHATANDNSRDGARLLLGGGMVFESRRSGIGVNVGFQKVLIDGGDTMFGAALRFNTR